MDHDRPTDRTDLISKLCLEAGRIMEDLSFELALAMPPDSSLLSERLKQTQTAGEDIAALAAAAQVLFRRSVDQPAPG